MTSSSRYCNRNQQRRSFLLSRLVTVVVIATNILRLRAFASLGKKVANRAMVSSSLCSSSSSSSSAASSSSTCLSNSNPLLESWTAQPFSLPPFEKIEVDHFSPALEVGMEEHLKDLSGIVNNNDPPTFDNVIVAYDRSGSIFDKVAGVFGNMCSSQNTPELQKIQTDMTPILSRHSSATYTLPGLFEKIQHVFEDDAQEGLSDEDRRLIERIHLDFTRAGAHFTEDKQKENADIQAKLASLTTEFSQNVMKDEESYELVLKRDDLSGCPDSLIEAAKNAAEERSKEDDEYVITLSRSLVEPFLTFSDRRDLRKIAFEAWTTRGEMNPDRDNLKIATDILKLRQKQARLHGYKNFAEYQLVDRMAKKPEKVIELLENVWQKAKVSANQEREALEEFVKQSNDGKDDADTQDIIENNLQAWDWRYYAEKVRIAKYDFDESLLKPYLSLDSVTNAVMAVSNKLFGLKYILRDDITSYHESVKTYEVRDERNNDKLVALFIHDNYARPYKSGGAWMSEYRSQTKNISDKAKEEYQGIPIVSNNNNFAKGRNTLLSFDDATTLFHEMVSFECMLCVKKRIFSSFCKQSILPHGFNALLFLIFSYPQ
jgi:peptidyl-dipeptidase Dcp